MTLHARLACGAAMSLILTSGALPALAQSTDTGEVLQLDEIIVTAEEQIKQALGSSTITAEDLEKQPVVNDVAEIIRKMPGVNMSGTSSTGQRGNQRQIDIRGMGPENVLILIDGKPVLSRTSVKMGRSGERDTRGDTNWVPAEMIERIEVIRGPAAARYGSGAAGGVVNIITKQPDHDLVQLGFKYDMPESSLEGATQRYNMLWAKRISDTLSFRFSGNYNKSEGDDASINASVGTCETDSTTGEETCSYDAGMEGVVNKDATLRLSWAPTDTDKFDFDLGYSHQSNEYAGDTQLGGRVTSTGDSTVDALADEGAETNTMERSTFGVTHHGDYNWGRTMNYLQYEHTKNRRLSEGTAGSSEGTINATDTWDTAILDAVAAKSEAYIDHYVLGRPSAITLGAEMRWERLDLSDYSSFSSLTTEDGAIDTANADPVTEQTTLGLYLEDNIQWNEALTLTPGLRVDYADTFGINISGGLNASYALSSEWTLKGGVARAFKSPTLYQLSDSYVYSTSGNGCPYPYYRNGPCYVIGNSDLDPEHSINTEIGVAYSGTNQINGTLTYFHNFYKDKIQAGTDQVGTVSIYRNGAWTDARLYQWTNIPDAEVSGLEGSFAAPLAQNLSLSVNGTYMISSKQKLHIDGGTTTSGTSYDAIDIEVPLSLVPKYTINASLNWAVTDRFTVTPSLTHYGKTKATSYSGVTGYEASDTTDLGSYTIVNLGLSYEFENGANVSGGVTNVFDKSILRSGDGANTYNEAGRAFYVGLTKTF
ncbi:FepA family TonB-dependent siderophore receptor [Thioclava sp. GXIMD4215]|uniref:FepA family TonB-dependent siderophore receptor n=1 Tax=Thioclava sp. GXIMD4215 TaxID=3131928 RepID=UPI00311B1B8F